VVPDREHATLFLAAEALKDAQVLFHLTSR
jgi:hypothetical protein